MSDRGRRASHAAGLARSSSGVLSEDDFSPSQIEQVEFALLTNTNTGLSSAEAAERLLKYGPNELEDKRTPAILVFLSYFWGPCRCARDLIISPAAVAYMPNDALQAMIWVAIIIEMINGILSGEGWIDMGVLLALQFANAIVGFFEEHNAGNAVAALRQKLQARATTLRDGKWADMPARELVPGDVIRLVIGDVTPADAILYEGKPLSLDESTLNGESLPRAKYPYEPFRSPKDTLLYMSCAVKQGENHALVMCTGKHTFFGKTAAMINSAGNQGMLHKVLLRITIALLVVSVVLCSIIFAAIMTTPTPADYDPSASGENPNKVLTSISVVVVILVASIPIAIEVVCTSTLAVGSHSLSSHGIIVTRLAAIEALAGMQILCSDKTGTLTLNKLSLREPIVLHPDYDADRVLFVAALASSRGERQDAIDTVINGSLSPANKGLLHRYEEIEFVPFNPVDKKAVGILRVKDGVDAGNVVRAAKGAPQVIANMAWNAAEVRDAMAARVRELASRGFRALGVAICISMPNAPQVERWEVVGILALFDPPRHDTAETISRAVEARVSVKMITGDAKDIAMETCKQLMLGEIHQEPDTDNEGKPVWKTEIDPTDPSGQRMRLVRDAAGNPVPRPRVSPLVYRTEHLNDKALPKEELEGIIMDAHAFAEVMPEHKFQIVKVLQGMSYVTGMTGDGVNDAPALKQADVGIAVDGATDAAKAAADLVLTKPGLSVIIEAMSQSRAIFQRMRNYLIYRIACTVQLLCFFFISALAINPDGPSAYSNVYPKSVTPLDPEFEHAPQFTLPVIALIIITILNDGCMITISHDYVVPEKRPQTWLMHEMWTVALVLGFIACFSSLLMLGLLVNANKLHPGNGVGILFGSYRRDYVLWGEIRTVMYLKISVSDFLTLFSARTRSWFFERPLGRTLGIAAGFALTMSTMLSLFWDQIINVSGAKMLGLRFSSGAVLSTWMYCILWFLVQDAGKVFTYLVMDWYMHRSSRRAAKAREQKRGKADAGAAVVEWQPGASHRASVKPTAVANPLRVASVPRPAHVEMRSIVETNGHGAHA